MEVSFIMHTCMTYTSYPYYISSCAYFQQLCDAGFNYFNCLSVKAESQKVYMSEPRTCHLHTLMLRLESKFF